MPSIFRDYAKDKADIKRFLTDFYTDQPDIGSQPGGKAFKYSKQLVIYHNINIIRSNNILILSGFKERRCESRSSLTVHRLGRCSHNRSRPSRCLYEQCQEIHRPFLRGYSRAFTGIQRQRGKLCSKKTNNRISL